MNSMNNTNEIKVTVAAFLKVGFEFVLYDKLNYADTNIFNTSWINKQVNNSKDYVDFPMQYRNIDEFDWPSDENLLVDVEFNDGTVSADPLLVKYVKCDYNVVSFRPSIKNWSETKSVEMKTK